MDRNSLGIHQLESEQVRSRLGRSPNYSGYAPGGSGAPKVSEAPLLGNEHDRRCDES